MTRPMLHLSVREITSVSATFILSSNLDSSTDPSLSSLDLTDHPPTTNNDQPTHIISLDDDPHSHESPPPSLIADSLSKGLSVSVNGSAWPRTFIRIDEQIDEAVIIIYALMPGRQYDIQLGLASCQNEQIQQQQHEQATAEVASCSTLRRQIVTQEHDSDDQSTHSPSSSSSSSSSPLSSPSSSTPPTSSSFITPPPPSHPQHITAPTSTTPPPPPPPLPLQPTLTDRLTQLHQTLTHLSTERDTLLSSLKSLRRESQKADASLRAEIDTLKRTFDKNASFELRSRQKLLALQESVKRAQIAARESQQLTKEVEVEILELTKRKEEKENEHRKMEDEAAKVRRERGDGEEKERKRVEGMRGELNGLTNKLERLNGKRERMEEIVIPDLVAKVQGIEGEIEDAEREVAKLEREEQIRLQFEDNCLSYHQVWGPLSSSSSTSTSAPRPAPSHNPRSHSMHSSTTPLIYPPHRRSSTKSTSMSLSPTTHFVDRTSPVKLVNVPDPLAVGAGRPSRRSFEATTTNRPTT